MEETSNHRQTTRSAAVVAQSVIESTTVKKEPLEEDISQEHSDAARITLFEEVSTTNCAFEDPLADTGEVNNPFASTGFTIDTIELKEENIIDESDEIEDYGDSVGLRTKKSKTSNDVEPGNSSSLPSVPQHFVVQERMMATIDHKYCITSSNHVPRLLLPLKKKQNKQLSDRSLKRKVMQLLVQRLENTQSTNQNGLQRRPDLEAFIRYIDMELRDVPHDMLPYVKKLMLDVIYMGQLGKLSLTSRIITTD